MPETDVLTVAAAAALLHESRWTTRRRIATGELPAHKTGDNTSAWLIRRADVDALIARQAAPALTAVPTGNLSAAKR